MNEIVNVDHTDFMKKYQKSENIMADIQNIIEESQKEAYRAVNTILTQRNWLIGYRISEEEMKGENRAEYGANIIKKLSAELTQKYGKGFTKSNLYSSLMKKPCPNLTHIQKNSKNRLIRWMSKYYRQ